MKGMAAEQRREHGLRPTQASTFFCMHLDEKNMLTSAGTTAPVLFFTAGYREASKSLASMADVAFPMRALSRKSRNFGLTSSLFFCSLCGRKSQCGRNKDRKVDFSITYVSASRLGNSGSCQLCVKNSLLAPGDPAHFRFPFPIHEWLLPDSNVQRSEGREQWAEMCRIAVRCVSLCSW